MVGESYVGRNIFSVIPVCFVAVHVFFRVAVLVAYDYRKICTEFSAKKHFGSA